MLEEGKNGRKMERQKEKGKCKRGGKKSAKEGRGVERA
jgi:hypothetical protein